MIKNLCKAVPDFLRTVSTPHKEILTHTHTLSLAVIHEKIIKQKFKTPQEPWCFMGTPCFYLQASQFQEVRPLHMNTYTSKL